MGEKTNTPDKLEEYMKKHGDITINGSTVSTTEKEIETRAQVVMDGALEAVENECITLSLSDAKTGEKIPVEKGTKASAPKDNGESR